MVGEEGGGGGTSVGCRVDGEGSSVAMVVQHQGDGPCGPRMEDIELKLIFTWREKAV